MAAASSSSTAGPPSSPLTDLQFLRHKPPPHLFTRPSLPYLSNRRRAPANSVVCLVSGGSSGGSSGGGGEVSDDFVSTRRAGCFYREFCVVATMLKQIEPLDTSLISKGVSDFVKDSMKQMISTMLGLLPVDEFSVRVRVSKRPLVRLLASSLITGYTLWNAEYRISLMKNLEISSIDMPKGPNPGDYDDDIEDEIKENEGMCDDNVGMENHSEELERFNLHNCFDDLSPEAMSYIQELESDLSTAEKELHTQKQNQETTQIGYATESNNDLLKYLRSLDSEMVDELSKPSSSEVKAVLQQLVHCTSRRVFKEDIKYSFMGGSKAFQENYQTGDANFSGTRDYLAKLLFWCMLLGHQLRRLENRLYLSCAISIL